MSKYPNIYPLVVFDLHKKVRAYLDQLNDEGQIDLDDNGYPYLISVDRNNNNFSVRISRNGKVENFVLNSRKKVLPLNSWRNDGFVRRTDKKVVFLDPVEQDGKLTRERQKKVPMKFIESLVQDILK